MGFLLIYYTPHYTQEKSELPQKILYVLFKMDAQLQKKIDSYKLESDLISTSLTLEKEQISILRKGYNINKILEWYFKSKGVL